MTDRELMQQALDALKLVYEQADFSNGVTDPTGTIDEGRVVIGGIVSESIQTLEAALAQPDQEMRWFQQFGDTQPEPKSISTNDHLCAMLRQVHDVLACTALPMKRPWVGLTDIDIHVLKMNYNKVKVVYTDHAEDLTVLSQDVDVDGLINAIQNKLKEVNT